MSGMKSITLLNKAGQPIHARYRYKKPDSAVHRAVALSMGSVTPVQIWDLRAGRELATVTRFYNEVRIHIPKRRQ